MPSRRPINPIILTLLISDAVMMTGFGLVEPIFAIFVQGIEGASIVSVGIASAIFMTVKSVLQLPFSKIVDATDHTERAPHKHRATAFLGVGMLFITATPVMYYFSTHVWHIYLAQALYGIGAGLAYPTWLKLWELHIDKGRESFEWTLYSTTTSLTVAASAIIGSVVVAEFGFRTSFLFVGLISLISCMTLAVLYNDTKSVIAIPIKE
jgi:DHA1 family quinolone resistance protein-like MFS transporter